MKFVDEAYIDISAGDGGAGCVSFRHEKYKEFGGPMGVTVGAVVTSLPLPILTSIHWSISGSPGGMTPSVASMAWALTCSVRQVMTSR